MSPRHKPIAGASLVALAVAGLSALVWSADLIHPGQPSGDRAEPAASADRPAAASGSVHPVDTLKPGEWYEVPNSSLSGARVLPSPVPPGFSGPVDVMDGWSGGAYDTKRDRLIIWGGGHGGYAGNEIYVFDVKTLSWSRVWGPSANNDIDATYLDDGDCHEVYRDGAPASRHTYDSLVYLPALDKLWAAGGSLYDGSGCGSKATWLFDFGTKRWKRRADWPGNGNSQYSDYDPVTGHVFVRSQDWQVFGEYDPIADTWRERSDDAVDGGEEMTAAIDPNKRLFVAIGNGFTQVFRLDTGTPVAARMTGGEPVINARGAGIVYDPTLKKIVGWAGGASVYSLDTTRWHWTEHRAAPKSATPAGDPNRLLSFSKFQYIPAKNAYIVVNSINDNVFFYKLSPASQSSVSSAPEVALSAVDAAAPPQSEPSPATGQASNKLNLPLRKWVPRPRPPLGKGGYPAGGGNKHARLLFDSKRRHMVLAGGDQPWANHDGNGNNIVWAYDLAADQWIRLTDWCVPPGQPQPGRPDNVVWIYDSKRDQGILLPGFIFVTQDGPRDCRDETGDALIFDFATRRWRQPPFGPPPDEYGGDIGGNFGVYDPVTDAVMRFRNGDWGNVMEVLSRASDTWEVIQLGSQDSPVRFTVPTNDQSAIDVRRRNVYVISREMRALLRYSIPAKTVAEVIPLPDGWMAPPEDQETYMIFDPGNRVLLHPNTLDYDGHPRALFIYHVDTKRWEIESVPADVNGNVLGFDIANNVLLFLGRSGRSESFWLYRYGNGGGPPT